MSDTMMLGVLRMPVDVQDDISLMQFIGRAREAADRIESDNARLAELAHQVATLEAERDDLITNVQQLVASHDTANQKNRELVATVEAQADKLDEARESRAALNDENERLRLWCDFRAQALQDIRTLSEPGTEISKITGAALCFGPHRHPNTPA